MAAAATAGADGGVAGCLLTKAKTEASTIVTTTKQQEQINISSNVNSSSNQHNNIRQKNNIALEAAATPNNNIHKNLKKNTSVEKNRKATTQ